ncbi:MAG TPA: GtrA family protein [Acidimicrobiales bacterium]|nr:GtrA family protein [Acidimicrobiales bacterium]
MSLVRKLARYTFVSAISTTVSLAVLGALVATAAVTPGWANVIATGIGTVPSFELNRRWVWRHRGRRLLVAQVLPFCALSLLGLVLSTVAVHAATAWAASAGAAATTRALVAQAANVGTFGALWAVQFVVLDRVLFARRPPALAAAGRTRAERAPTARAA